MNRPTLLLLALMLGPGVAAAQSPAPTPPDAGVAPASKPGEIALAPSRFQLPLAPGDSQTVVVNVISSGGTKPVRLLASLGDWVLSTQGEMQFSPPGSQPQSATDWMIYSPVELTVGPGESYPIRVTIDVPPDATPGDHTAVLFVEERPPDIKTKQGEKMITFHFRLAAVFYVMISPLTREGTLTGLDATADAKGITVVPTLHNDGNSHVRPVHAVEVLDALQAVVASKEQTEIYPVLGHSDLRPSVRIDQELPPGEYTVKYRVDFRDGSGKLVEGRKTITVAEPAAVKKPAPEQKPSDAKPAPAPKPSGSKPVPKKKPGAR